ncbi:hypothetical protein [Rhodoblastus sp.]|uniref:hypothetical protein n=1 Tax=Rhodoblastus sp. TaxID=1962975 RepID=UPI003F9CB906
MGILFLLAVLLAWPTAGLSVVAYIAFFIFQSLLKAKTRMHHSDKLAAQRAVRAGSERVPTWAGTRDKSETFVYTIQNFAMEHGVPQAFLQAVLGDSNTFKTLVHYAGAMEEEGASFIEQQMAVSEKLIELWSVAPKEVQEAALSE